MWLISIAKWGAYDRAETHYRRALKLREETPGHTRLDTAATLLGLAILYDDMGHYAKAEPLFDRALDIYEHIQDADASYIASALSGLALLKASFG
ncbi:MAG: tetratricopeptide repeat protein [Caldilineaceae bacterium]|nr:tetratricopeptide repeat protein [Caldilineaceae bacterium]